MRWRGMAIAVGVLAIACTAPTRSYVEDRASGTSFAIPEGWESVDLQTGGQSPLDVPDDHIMRRLFFPAGATPPNTWPPTGDEPFGLTVAWTLTPDEQEEMSIKRLRNTLAPIDQTQEQAPDSIAVVEEELLVADGYRGETMVVTMRLKPSPDDPGPSTATFTQTTYLDPFTTTAYVFAVGCSLSCYETNQQTIEEIAASWSVIPS